MPAVPAVPAVPAAKPLILLPHPCLTSPHPSLPPRTHPQCLSWVFAPILSGIAAFLLFWAIRTLVLRSGDAYRRSLFLLPLFTFLTFFVVTWFIMAKGGTHYGWEKTPDSKKAWISATTAGIATLLSIAVGIPLIRRKVSRDMAAKEL